MRITRMLTRPYSYILLVFYILAGFSTLGSQNRLAVLWFDKAEKFEKMGVLVFFVTAFVLFYGIIRALRWKPANWYLRIGQRNLFELAFVLFLGFGGEISRGQRVFNIQTRVAAPLNPPLAVYFF